VNAAGFIALSFVGSFLAIFLAALLDITEHF
jgi:hypothetical protein